eukprot:30445-Pelagococcus_subviridis.AAC.4
MTSAIACKETMNSSFSRSHTSPIAAKTSAAMRPQTPIWSRAPPFANEDPDPDPDPPRTRLDFPHP